LWQCSETQRDENELEIADNLNSANILEWKLQQDEKETRRKKTLDHKFIIIFQQTSTRQFFNFSLSLSLSLDDDQKNERMALNSIIYGDASTPNRKVCL